MIDTFLTACRTPFLAWFASFLFPLHALAAQEGVPVTVVTAEQQEVFRQVKITGTVTSPHVAQLSPAISGLITAFRVDEGDRVDAGSVLIELDPELVKLQWQSAKAMAKQAQSALNDSKRRLQEAQHLAPQRGIAETVVKGLEAEVAEDQAALERAVAEADYQQALLARHQVRAPFAGVVSRKLGEQGEWINPGAGVVELVATEQLRLDFAVAENYLADLQADTQIQITLDAIPGQQYGGSVQAIVPVTDPGARTFLLRVVPDVIDQRMIPGMSATALLQIPTQRKGIAVPRDATLRQPSGRVVVWSVENSEQGLVAKEHPVEVGQAFAGWVEIISGLSAGARVVVRGNEALQNGQLVKIRADKPVSE